VAGAAAAALLLSGLVAFHSTRLAGERDRARVEAQKASQLSEVLSGLLTAADPYTTSKEPTVRGLLDAAAGRLSKELAGQPEVQVEMLGVMGRVYQRMDLFDKAKPLLEEALAVSRRIHGAEHVRVAQGLHDLGVLRRQTGDLAAAEQMLDEALAMRRSLLGPERKEVADTLEQLAHVYDGRGQGPLEPVIREALAIRRKLLGEEHRDTLDSLTSLGAVFLLRDGNVAAGEPLLRQALAGYRKIFGEGHPAVSSALANVAVAAQNRGDHAEAESLLREALSIDRRTLGDRHVNVAVVLYNLAWSLRLEGKHAEAAAALEEALSIARPALGADHLRTIHFSVGLARVRLDQGQAAAAEPSLRQALRVRQDRMPPDEDRVGSVKGLLGAALVGLRRYDEAEALLLDAEKILVGAGGTGAKGTGVDYKATLAGLAALHEARRRPEEAARYRALASH
jgi:tetratricopeptide (TPR) repeat protein